MIRKAPLLLVLALTACSPRSDDRPATPEMAPSPGAPAATPAVADDPAAYRGSALARQVCARCHDVGAGAPPAEQVGAPDFRDLATHGLASQGELTAASLAEWMRASHPDMPNFMLGDGDTADLVAYIASLRPR